MKFTKVLIRYLCATFLFVGTQSLLPTPTLAQDTTPKAVAKENPVSKVDSAAIQRERQSTIKSLLSVVNDESSDKSLGGSLSQALFSLGEIRAVEGVASLAQHLSFLGEVLPNQRVSVSPQLTEKYYVSAVALVKVGEPSDVVQEMTRKIATTDSKLDWALASWVLMQLRGKEATTQILEETGRELNETTKYHFIWAADYVKDYQVALGDPRGKVMGGSIKSVIK